MGTRQFVQVNFCWEKLVFAIELPRFCHVMVLALIMFKHTLVPEAASQLNQTGHTVNPLQTPGVFNKFWGIINWREASKRGRHLRNFKNI